MKQKYRRYLLPTINIVIPLICFIILLFSKLSDNTLYLILMTGIIGWIIPYFVLLITGLSLISLKQPKLTLIFNSLNIILSIMIIIFNIRLIDKSLLIMLIEYIIMTCISVTNTIYLIIYIKKNISKENNQIKKIKKQGGFVPC